MPAPDWISTGRAAALLGVSAQTVVDYANAGKIAHMRLPSGHRRFRAADVERIIEDHRVEPEGAA